MRSIVRADESYDESRDGWVILGGGDTDGSAYWQPKVTIEAVSRSDADEIEVSLWRRHPLFRWKRTEKIAGGKPRWSGGSASWTGGDAVRTGRWRNTILEIEVHWAEKKRRQRHVVDLVTRGYQFAVYALFALVLGIGWLVRPAFFEAAIPMLEKPLESWLALGGLVTGWGGLELMGGFLLEKVLKREPAPLSLPLRQLLLFPIGGLAAAAALILLTPVAVACNTTGAQPELAVVGKLAPAGSDGACRALLGSEIELRSGPDAPRVHSAPASCDESWAKSRPSASCFKLGCESRSWGPFPLNATTDCKVDGLAGAPAPEVATLDGKPFEAPAQWTAKDGFKASSTCMVAKGTPVKLLDAKAAGVRRAVVRGQRDGKLVELSTFDSEAGSSEAWLCTPPVFDEVALAGDAIEWQVPAAWIAGPRLSIAESTPATCQKGLADEELLAVRLLGVQSVGAGAWLGSRETSDARAASHRTTAVRRRSTSDEADTLSQVAEAQFAEQSALASRDASSVSRRSSSDLLRRSEMASLDQAATSALERIDLLSSESVRFDQLASTQSSHYIVEVSWDALAQVADQAASQSITTLDSATAFSALPTVSLWGGLAGGGVFGRAFCPFLAP